MSFTPMYFSKIEISTYIAKYRIEEKITISILEAKIKMGQSDFASKSYYIGRNIGESEMITMQGI